MEELQIENKEDITREDLLVAQKSFLQSTIGKIVDNAIDKGIEKILPDFIEDDVIDIKNAFFYDGYKEGFDKIIDTIVETNKNIKGLITGEFESISQIKEITENNGLLDGISEIIDKGLGILVEKEVISKSTSKLIKSEKKEILSEISDNLEELYKDQSVNFEKIYNYCEKWKEAYKNEDFKTMETNYKKIESLLEETLPIENILEEAKEIKNLHTLIKNNNKNFNLTDEEKELAEKLIS